jgi:hypothetical protein
MFTSFSGLSHNETEDFIKVSLTKNRVNEINYFEPCNHIERKLI